MIERIDQAREISTPGLMCGTRSFYPYATRRTVNINGTP
jgi:hypothetical protein